MSEDARRGNRWLAALPVVIFMIIAIGFGIGLSGDPSKVPSALIGKPVPDFTLPAIPELGVPGFDSASLKAVSRS